MRMRYVIPAAALTALLGGCGGEDSASTQSSSTLNLSLTDAPVTGATKVWLQFTGVEVKPVNGSAQSFPFSPAKGFDLLTLQNGNSATLLGDTSVPAGEYEWIRLMVDPAAGSSYLVDANGQHPLRIPSGSESGLKLIRGFTMPAGGRADFTVDFVLHKSIIAPPGQAPNLLMKPVLRIVDNIQVGTLAGSFTTALPAACTGKVPVVYLYQGGGIVPDDIYNPIDGSADTNPAVDPLVTANATAGVSGGPYTYRIAFVPVGTYTVSFSCDADDPAVDENVPPAVPINFVTYPQPVTIALGQTTTANF